MLGFTHLPSAERARLTGTELGLCPVGTACFLMGNGSSQPREAFFMIQRTGSHGPGTWTVPGGWVDAGEDPHTTVAREVWEEVGITLEPGDLHELGWTWNQHPEGLENVTLWFQALGYTGEPRGTYDAKVAATQWATRTTMPGPLFAGFLPAVHKGLVP